jgi:hypothetical protein
MAHSIRDIFGDHRKRRPFRLAVLGFASIEHRLNQALAERLTASFQALSKAPRDSDSEPDAERRGQACPEDGVTSIFDEDCARSSHRLTRCDRKGNEGERKPQRSPEPERQHHRREFCTGKRLGVRLADRPAHLFRFLGRDHPAVMQSPLSRTRSDRRSPHFALASTAARAKRAAASLR